jgi:hypothetical protein
MFNILEANRLNRYISKNYPILKAVKYSNTKAIKEE